MAKFLGKYQAIYPGLPILVCFEPANDRYLLFAGYLDMIESERENKSLVFEKCVACWRLGDMILI